MSEILAYLAGIVDGEGYIGIKKTKPHTEKNGAKSPSYHERIQIRMTDEDAIRLLAETLGGWYYKEKPGHHQSRLPLYCYAVSDKKASEIINKLLPWLRVKKRDALLVLELRARKNANPKHGNGFGRMTDEELEAREQLYKACRKLHGTGGD